MKNSYRIIIYLLLLGVFNLLFFGIGGTNHAPQVWVSYAFVYVGFIVSFISVFYCKHYSQIPENLSLIYLLSWIYTIVAVVFNSILIVIGIASVKFSIIVNLMAIAVYIILLLLNLNISANIEDNVKKRNEGRTFVDEASAKLKICMDLAAKTEIRKDIEKAYDSVRTCPVYSSDKALEFENEIVRLCGEIEGEIDKNNYDGISVLTNAILKNVQKRNACL